MGHLNKLHEEYASKGLVIMASSPEPESAIQQFVDEFEAKYPVMIEESDTYAEYGFGALPRAVLIGPAGRVLFKEHPNRLTVNHIDNHLESMKLLPEFPKPLRAVGKAIDSGDYGKAHKKATAALKKDDLKETAQQAIEWIDWLGTTWMEAAKGAAEAGSVHAAYTCYECIEDAYKGLPLAAEAKKAAAGLKADKANKLEITAGEKLAALKKKLAKLSPSKAEKAIDAFLKKYGDTKAGPKAKALRPKRP